MAILKALEYIQKMEPDEKIVLVHTDSKITLQLLKNKKKTYKTHKANLNQSPRNGTTRVEGRFQLDKGACRTSRKRNGGSTGERSSKKQEHRGVLHKNTKECGDE